MIAAGFLYWLPGRNSQNWAVIIPDFPDDFYTTRRIAQRESHAQIFVDELAVIIDIGSGGRRMLTIPGAGGAIGNALAEVWFSADPLRRENRIIFTTELLLASLPSAKV
jgi:hypothetical protein